MEDTQETQIARRAYELWEKAGRPEDKDQEFYIRPRRNCGTKKRPIGGDADLRAKAWNVDAHLRTEKPARNHLYGDPFYCARTEEPP